MLKKLSLIFTIRHFLKQHLTTVFKMISNLIKTNSKKAVSHLALIIKDSNLKY